MKSTTQPVTSITRPLSYKHFFTVPLFFVLTVVVTAGFFSCSSNSNTPVSNTPHFNSDSTTISQQIAKAIVQKDSTEIFLEQAKQLANKSNLLYDVYTFHLSRYYIQTGQLDAAAHLLDSMIQANKSQPTTYPLAGKHINLMAAVAAYKGNPEQSVTYYEEALRIFEESKDWRQAAAVHFNLANIFFSRLDFPASYQHITKAKEQFAAIKDSTYEALANGILAVSLIKLDSLPQGKTYADLTLLQSERLKNPMGIMLAHYAIGEYEHSMQNFVQAIQRYNQVLQLGEQYKIKNLEMPARAALLDAYVLNKDYNRAIESGEVALQLAKAMSNTDIQYNLNRNIAFAYEQKGDKATAFNYLKVADDVFRNSIMKNNQQVMQELLVKYEDEKKTNTIIVKESEIAKQRMYIGWLLVAVVLIMGLLIAYYNNNKQKKKIDELNKERAIAQAWAEGEEQERGRLASELHDGIASSLVAIRMQVENGSNLTGGNDKIVKLVNDTHREVRNIAHNLMPRDFTKTGWMAELRSFCKQVSSSEMEVNFYSNIEEVNIPQTHALVLFRAVQELTQNAIKHADTQAIAVQILQKDNRLDLVVEDSGTGFDTAILKEETKNKGIVALQKKLSKIHASLEIDSRKGNGTTAYIQYLL